MEVVLGIGGLFFRARSPESLAAWYREHLGVAVVPANYDDPVWQQQAGPTAFAPFEESTSYFGPGQKQWMVNFRVRSLEAMVGQLGPAGDAPVCMIRKEILWSCGSLARLMPALRASEPDALHDALARGGRRAHARPRRQRLEGGDRRARHRLGGRRRRRKGDECIAADLGTGVGLHVKGQEAARGAREGVVGAVKTPPGNRA